MRARLLLLLGGALLGACTTNAPAPAQYDFGLPPTAIAPSGPPLPLRDAAITVSAPPWLDTPALLYRPADAAPAALEAYAHSAWVGAPAALLQQRLREAAALRRAGAAPALPMRLRVALDEFSQVFAQGHSSRGLLRAHVQLISVADDGVSRERSFVVEVPAPSNDAAGALAALRLAADAFTAQVLDWAAAPADPAVPRSP